MVDSFTKLKYLMSLKLHFMDSHVEYVTSLTILGTTVKNRMEVSIKILN